MTESVSVHMRKGEGRRGERGREGNICKERREEGKLGREGMGRDVGREKMRKGEGEEGT